jgi:carboxyl-terminal processing protease
MTDPSNVSPRPSKLGLRLAVLMPTLALVGLLCTGTASNSSAAGNKPTAAATATTAAAPTVLHATDRHRKVARLVAEVVEHSHYRRAIMDEHLSAQVFDRYLDSLDASHSYFLQSDIKELEIYRPRLGEAIRTGSVEPAFVIFQRLQERNRAEIQAAIAFLDQEPDFKSDERYDYDRTKAPWPVDAAEQTNIWRQRVKNDALSLLLANKTWAEARDVLKKRYERLLKRAEQVTADDVFENFMNAYLHVYDPHSNYLSPHSSEEYNIAMKLSYVGIGASLQLIDDYVTIMNVIPGGPAAVSGLIKVNDRITGVAQGAKGEFTDVVGWRLDDVVQLIRGPAGTVVRLQILPAGASPGSKEQIYEFTRNKVTLESQASKKKIETVTLGDKTYKVGVIDVPSFYQDFEAKVNGDKEFRSTTRDVAKLIEELKAEKVDGLVMDLRANGGGNLSEAQGLVGLFIKKGPVVQLRETSGDIEVLDDPEPGPVWDGPLVVLVDRSSASASEIFSAAIQDYGRGLIVGQQTFGKGTVQNLYPLDRWALGPNAGYGELTVTIGKYYRVTGDSVQNRGVMPEIALPSMLSIADMGESTRESALPWDRIRPVDFAETRAMDAALPTLTKHHDERMTSDPDLQELKAETAAVEALRKEKSVSLNLDVRRTERDRDDAHRLELINTRRAAHGDAPLKSLEDIKPDEQPDANLAEAGRIVVELGQWLKNPPAPAAPVTAQHPAPAPSKTAAASKTGHRSGRR